MSFQRILVPVDLSEGTEAVVNVASELASPLGARVTLLHVFDLSRGSIRGGIHYPGKINLSISEEIVARLEKEIASTVGILTERGVEADGRVVRGIPSYQILDMADEIGADLILIARRSPRSLRRSILGSVSKRVLARARVPVLCLNHGVQSIGEPAPRPEEPGASEDEELTG